MFYQVTLTKDSNGTILVRFPDVPGAVTDKRDIPAPSTSKGPGVDVPILDASKITLYQTMRDKKINKTELAKRLDWHMPQVDRVLKMRHDSRLEHVEAAFRAVGKRLSFTVTDDESLVPGAIVTKALAQRTRSPSVGRSVRASKKR